MRSGRPSLSILLFLAALAGLAESTMVQPASAFQATKDDDHPVVVLDTTAGPITVELDRAKTPISVENFLKYVDSGYYNGLVFHRVIPGFMVQGGGMTVDGDGKLTDKNPSFPPIKNESKTGLSNARGTIAMARTGDPNSATSQFFINHANNTRLDTYGGGYTAFGKVIEGMDVVDAIAKTKTDMTEGAGGVPVKPILIKGAKRKS